ncbi:hypothetical protein [Terasakiella pusilla]|uniref:hypothetical protein n=1 Tax=Terasakiella pusilla TaxID=64973 RepID=UPI003AA8F8C3
MKYSSVSFVLISIALGGCAPTWTKAGASQRQFNYDMAECQALANGAAPMQRLRPIQQSQTHHSGTAYGSNGNAYNYSGTSYQSTNAAVNLAPSISNIGVAVRQGQIIENCMYRKRYSKQAN